jgi:hypothetical protein
MLFAPGVFAAGVCAGGVAAGVFAAGVFAAGTAVIWSRHFCVTLLVDHSTIVMLAFTTRPAPAL